MPDINEVLNDDGSLIEGVVEADVDPMTDPGLDAAFEEALAETEIETGVVAEAAAVASPAAASPAATAQPAASQPEQAAEVGPIKTWADVEALDIAKLPEGVRPTVAAMREVFTEQVVLAQEYGSAAATRYDAMIKGASARFDQVLAKYETGGADVNSLRQDVAALLEMAGVSHKALAQEAAALQAENFGAHWDSFEAIAAARGTPWKADHPQAETFRYALRSYLEDPKADAGKPLNQRLLGLWDKLAPAGPAGAKAPALVQPLNGKPAQRGAPAVMPPQRGNNAASAVATTQRAVGSPSAPIARRASSMTFDEAFDDADRMAKHLLQ